MNGRFRGGIAMSVSRQQRRAMQRKFPGMDKEHAERMVLAVREAGRASRDIKADEIQAEAWGEMILMVLAYLHIDKGHTGKYLRKFLDELDDFMASVSKRRGAAEELKQILKDECGFDLEAEYGKLLEKGKEEAA